MSTTMELKKVQPSSFPGWDNYPVYLVLGWEDYEEVRLWMRENGVESFLVSSGVHGYRFQVQTNHEWFMLKWL